jgi:hypothetical protein
MSELAPQVSPPRAMDFGPAEDLLDPAVIDRDQVRALARQELPGRNPAEPVPALRRLDVIEPLPQSPGRPVLGNEVTGLRIHQPDAQRNPGKQTAELSGTIVEHVQGVMPDDRHAQRADGQQILGREPARHLRPVAAPAKPLKVGTGVSSPPCSVLGEVRLHQPEGKAHVTKLVWNVDTHRISAEQVPGNH